MHGNAYHYRIYSITLRGRTRGHPQPSLLRMRARRDGQAARAGSSDRIAFSWMICVWSTHTTARSTALPAQPDLAARIGGANLTILANHGVIATGRDLAPGRLPRRVDRAGMQARLRRHAYRQRPGDDELVGHGGYATVADRTRRRCVLLLVSSVNLSRARERPWLPNRSSQAGLSAPITLQ